MLSPSGIGQTIFQAFWRLTITLPILQPGIKRPFNHVPFHPITKYQVNNKLLKTFIQLCEMAGGSGSPSGPCHHLHRRQRGLDRVLSGGDPYPKQSAIKYVSKPKHICCSMFVFR